MSRLQITAEKISGVVVINVEGEMDVYTIGKLKEAISMVTQSGAVSLAVNLGLVTYMDSSGLGLLLGLHKQLAKSHGTLVVAGPSGAVREVLRATNADRLLKIVNTKEEAAQFIVDNPFGDKPGARQP
ncbi:MAG TPA: STAS domain-containing protein [Candidatus Ozemobacteraceae bacterium]|nr:STAS domain-containing protein [Candidatus Ozemobacteraceae bacterium]HQG30044.1 STAS domain-containing protein [Candidatus Ozemobacteraceae bacterium]